MKTTIEKNTIEKNTIDRTALCERILIQYETLEEFADRTNVNIDRLKGKEEFVLGDIESITSALNLNEREVKAFFFPEMEPEDPKHATINLLAMQGIIRRLEHIEDGLNALDMITTGRILEVGDTISNEDFRDALEFVLHEVSEKVTDLRAELCGKYFGEYLRLTKN